MKLKQQLDDYVSKYETKEFIKDDPVQFVHRFKNKDDIEIAGFIASMFSYGKREAFIAKLNKIFDLMENKPRDYVKTFDYKTNNIADCDYRFSKDCDLVLVLKILHTLYDENETLGTLFKYSYDQKCDIWDMFRHVTDYFYERVDTNVTKGFYHLLPNPAKKSALKRMNMLLRWFVRKSDVDIGIWDFIPKSELLIPLDTHCAKTARKLNLLKRKDNGYESVIELTESLKEFDPLDPVKYDFALFGYGVNNKV